jgi:hypothetical protein
LLKRWASPKATRKIRVAFLRSISEWIEVLQAQFDHAQGGRINSSTGPPGQTSSSCRSAN